MKIKAIYSCCIAVLSILLIGCGESKKGTENGVPVVDLSKAGDWGMFNIGELVDSLEVIPLETTEESLVPGYFKIWRGEKYILILGTEAVLQFTLDGRFVRQLARKGRAPEEYTDRAGFAVNEKAGRLCIADWSSKVKQYDLTTGEFLGSQDWKYGVMHEVCFLPDERLVYVPYVSRGDTLGYAFCQTTWDGKWLSGIKSESQEGGIRMGDSYLNEVGGEVHFMGSENDTLYVIRDTVKTPLLFIDVPNRYTLEKGGGNVLTMVMETPRWCIFRIWEQKIERIGEGGYTIHRKGEKIYAFDRKEGTLGEFLGIYTDKWGGRISLMEFHQHGEYLSTALTATELRQMQGKKSNGADTVKFLQYRQLLDTVQEDANPVILTGRIRR